MSQVARIEDQHVPTQPVLSDLLKQQILEEVTQMKGIKVENANVYVPFMNPDALEQTKLAGDLTIFQGETVDRIKSIILDPVFLRSLEDELVRRYPELSDSLDLSSAHVYQVLDRQTSKRVFLHISIVRMYIYRNVLRFSNG